MLKVQLNTLPTISGLETTNRLPKAEQNFKQHLQSALQELNTLQNESDVAFERLLAGDIEFHDAMIIAEKANLALQLTMAIRTKLLEAYQDIMRMQV